MTQERQDRSYLDALGRDSDTKTQARTPPKSPLKILTSHILSAHTARISCLAAMAIGVMGTAVNAIVDTAATGKGVEARAELLKALPEGTQLSKEDMTQLECIVSRAARTCENVVGTDQFEKQHCDVDALDAMKDSQGENMAIAGYSQGAKAVAARAGIEPLLECKGPATDKVLDIDVITLPGATSATPEAPLQVEIQLMPKDLPQGYQIF